MPVRHRWAHVAVVAVVLPLGTLGSTPADVTGITPTSAPVRDAAGRDLPVPVPARTVSVVLNPEGSFAVTDLASNPVGRRYTVLLPSGG